MTPAASPAKAAPATWRGRVRYLACCHGAATPLLAVLAIVALLGAMDALVELHRAVVPKPAFKQLLLPGYPAQTPLAEAAVVINAALWWLCMSFLQWLAALGVIGMCGVELGRAVRHWPRLAHVSWTIFLGVLALMIGALYHAAVGRGVSLLAFGPMVGNLTLISPRFLPLSSCNAALAFTASAALLCALSLLLLPGAHANDRMQQMRAITRLLYAGAVLMLVWICCLTAMYRLCAVLMIKDAREPALMLAPTVSLMGGLMLSLLLAAAVLSAAAWLQLCHDRERPGCTPGAPPATEEASPKSLLFAHWPKAIAILMPLLPGVADTVLQSLVKGP
jgi:hypothetical protein